MTRPAYLRLLSIAILATLIPSPALAAQLIAPGQQGSSGGSFPATTSFKLHPDKAGPGDVVTLDVTVTLEPGYHTYDLEQPDLPEVASKITLEPLEGLEPVGTWSGSPALEKMDDVLQKRILIHYDAVTWSQDFRVTGTLPAGETKINGQVRFTVCDDRGCLPPRIEKFSIALEISATGTSPGSSDEPASRVARSVEMVAAQSADESKADPSGTPQQFTVIRSQTQVTSLAAALGFGFLAGLILNVMPCVLPVIALKIYGFVKQAGEDRRTIRNLGLSFGAGILAIFLVLAAVAVIFSKGWGQLFQEEWFVVTMVVGLVAFALGMFDVWIINLPGFVSDAEAATAQKEGIGASFAKGMLATILSTPCSGPFLGAVLLYAMNHSAAVIFVIFTAIGLGMASPYIVLAWFPGWMRILPKPGEWMKTFKEFMGFLILGTAVWLLWQRRANGEFVVWTVAYCTLVGLALWLYGHWTNPLATTAKRRAAPVLALLIMSVGAYLCFGVMMQRQPSVPIARTMATNDEHAWQSFDLDRVMALREQGKTVVVDWTADW